MSDKRTQRLERFYQNSLHLKLLELMKIIEPGRDLHWGAKRHPDLVAYSCIHLALEYCSLTGVKPEDLLNPNRNVDDTTPSTTDIEHMYEGEALPLT